MSAGALLHRAQHGADGDRGALLDLDLGEHAGSRSRHLDGDLVGFELDQRLVRLHRVAGFLKPLPDGGLGHRSPSVGTRISIDMDLPIISGRAARGRGPVPARLYVPSASATSAFCSWRWRLSRPVAVAAEDARPA